VIDLKPTAPIFGAATADPIDINHVRIHPGC
jgi:hypothetical protein